MKRVGHAGQEIMKWLFLLFVAVICGCQYDPHAHLLATTKPNPSEVVGTYVLDSSVLPSWVEKVPEVTIELHADGTFIGRNIPSDWNDAPDKKFLTTLVDCKGIWEIRQNGEMDDNSKIWGVYLYAGEKTVLPPDFTGKYPHLGLIFELGDPDCGYALLLKKKS